MSSTLRLHAAPAVQDELPERARPVSNPHQRPLSAMRPSLRSIFEQDQSARAFYMSRQRAHSTPLRTSSHSTRPVLSLPADQIPTEPPPAYRARARLDELDFPPAYDEPPTYNEVWDSVIRGQIRPSYNTVRVSRQNRAREAVDRMVIDRLIREAEPQEGQDLLQDSATQHIVSVTATRSSFRSVDWVCVVLICFFVAVIALLSWGIVRMIDES
ncbi:hypothetical protein Slin15195_G047660 [Septoria linicola]|uniref:Uncharacterized protein n=1 Tax=Septoria linicola TaxID=215465 RepID=A0A9Q9ASY8_9PEZI|nr:hypothetical protein Slin14017_G051190 [Septoria linicola]USW51447.1 hypothetical protein Slin15195_G047660 [Septoria linicola]